MSAIVFFPYKNISATYVTNNKNLLSASLNFFLLIIVITILLLNTNFIYIFVAPPAKKQKIDTVTNPVITKEEEMTQVSLRQQVCSGSITLVHLETDRQTDRQTINLLLLAATMAHVVLVCFLGCLIFLIIIPKE